MEKRYALCLDVLKRFQDARVLQEVVLVGSWCMQFYKEHFKDVREGISVLTALVEQDEAAAIRKMFCKMPVSWRKKIENALAGCENEDIISRLMILLTVS